MSPFAPTAVTETWNGTNWTEVNDLNTGRDATLAGAGTNTAALGFGGNPASALTELWNGTNWSEQNDLNTGRDRLAGSGANTAALAFGGNPGAVALTEEFTDPGTITKTLTT